MSSLTLEPAVVPSDATFPPTSAQQMINFVAAYLQLNGLSALTGILISTTEPAAADRDKAWLKVDPATNRGLGLFTYRGGWNALPTIVENGDTAPAGAATGELFFDTTLKALEVYNGAGWTTSLFPSGATAGRPAGVPAGYLYYDTDISRLLRNTAQGWSTFDGGIGDVKMVDYADTATALQFNPGWSIFASLAGRFPFGIDDSHAPQSSGGTTLDQMQVKWSTLGVSAQGGSRDTNVLAGLKLAGVDGSPTAKLTGPTPIVTDQIVNLTPPYQALIFLRKDY